MTDSGSAPGAVEIIDDAEAAVDGKRVELGDILEAVGHRRYGPVYVLIALVCLTPIGTVPGSPNAFAASRGQATVMSVRWRR